jgi:hypothetical protein
MRLTIADNRRFEESHLGAVEADHLAAAAGS